MRIYLVDAFTTERFAGNPAGVVLDADKLTRSEKQQIASEIHASETAFATQLGTHTFKVDFFTPTTEVDFCGHATVALFHTLASTGRIKLQEGRQERRIDLLEKREPETFPLRSRKNKDRSMSP